MDDRLRDLIRHRAGDRCEYCLIPQAATPYFRFHVDHIVAKQHLVEADDLERLAWACHLCNLHKGTNLTSIDPESRQVVRLFDPRQDDWRLHFCLKGGQIVGLTATGRATVRLLNMNAPHRIELREAWLDEGHDFS